MVKGPYSPCWLAIAKPFQIRLSVLKTLLAPAQPREPNVKQDGCPMPCEVYVSNPLLPYLGYSSQSDKAVFCSRKSTTTITVANYRFIPVLNYGKFALNSPWCNARRGGTHFDDIGMVRQHILGPVHLSTFPQNLSWREMNGSRGWHALLVDPASAIEGGVLER